MAFFGLFGNKTKYVDEPDNENNNVENQESFFLNSDDAKTLGNIDYMRKSIKIRRTFPKTKNGKGAEVIKEISSMEINKSSVSNSSPTQQSQPQPTTQNTSTNNQRRPVDNNMDTFRKMARDLKK